MARVVYVYMGCRKYGITYMITPSDNETDLKYRWFTLQSNLLAFMCDLSARKPFEIYETATLMLALQG